MVIRAEKKNNFTVISNKLLRDKNLSVSARGLMAIMLSLPDDWRYSLAGLSKAINIGINALRTAISELEQYGYIKRERVRQENGQLGGTVYTLYEHPAAPAEETERAEEAAPAEPVSENHIVDSHTYENQSQLNNESPIKEKQKKESLRESSDDSTEKEIDNLFNAHFSRVSDKSFITAVKNMIAAKKASMESVIDCIKKAARKQPRNPEAYILGIIKSQSNQIANTAPSMPQWELDWIEQMERRKAMMAEWEDTDDMPVESPQSDCTGFQSV